MQLRCSVWLLKAERGADIEQAEMEVLVAHVREVRVEVMVAMRREAVIRPEMDKEQQPGLLVILRRRLHMPAAEGREMRCLENSEAGHIAKMAMPILAEAEAAEGLALISMAALAVPVLSS